MKLTALLVALALASPVFAQDDTADDTDPVPAALCFRDCISDHADRILTRELAVTNTRHHKCEVARTLIVGGRLCEETCTVVWKATGRPAIPTRNALRRMIEADELAYDATACGTAEPLEDGLVVMEHSFSP